MPGDLNLRQTGSRDLNLLQTPGSGGSGGSSSASLDASLPALLGAIEGSYDSNLWQGVATESLSRWEAGEGELRAVCAPHADAGHSRREVRHLFELGCRTPTITCQPLGDLPEARRGACVVYEAGHGLSREPCDSFAQLPASTELLGVVYERAEALPEEDRDLYKDLFRDRRPLQCHDWQEGRRRPREHLHSWKPALWLPLRECGRYEEGILIYGWGGPIEKPAPRPKPAPEPCARRNPVQLVLRATDRPWLLLRSCREGSGQYHFIPVRLVYLVMSDARLIRVSDNTEIELLSLELSIDADSFVWRFSADLPAPELNKVLAATPVEVEANVQGITWRFLVEEVRRSRQFARAAISISGRGLAAELAEPYSPEVFRTSSQDRTAQQLMEELLTVNGVPLGWTIDWRLTDWLIPGGVWSHKGTYIAGVRKIAEAAGGYVQADRTQKTLHILHRYPIPPWNWGTAVPDLSIPEAVVLVEGVEWREKPEYNAVYVMGETAGIIGQVVRSGTAGDRVAPQFVHPLITAQEAARQAGLAILAEGGKRRIVSLSLPLDPSNAIPLVEVGQLVEYGSEQIRGLVRGVTIRAERPSIRQQITVEAEG